MPCSNRRETIFQGVSILLMNVLIACETQEGHAEQAVRKIGEAIEKAGQSLLLLVEAHGTDIALLLREVAGEVTMAEL
jgi:creatinine amidohydrolase/Fe(II)-dependent formamide hydrolase-like protein